MQAEANVLHDASQKPRRVGNFGAIRLILSISVIISHTPELVDGTRQRELLTILFGTLSLGEVAVLGFFLLSGYLLTESLQSKPNLLAYFIKRIGRIYPAFVVACLLCLFIVAPLGGGTIGSSSQSGNLLRLVLLLPPESDGIFAHSPFPILNGSLWTIHDEFICYFILAILSAIGLIRRSRWIAIVAATILIATVADPAIDPATIAIVSNNLGPSSASFLSAFLIGAVYRLWLNPARRTGPAAGVAAIAAIAALSSPLLAQPVFILGGGYVLIWFGELRTTTLVNRIGDKTDLSYGIYLFAWPVQKLLTWNLGMTNLLAIDVVTVIVASTLAVGSWHLIEKPCIQAARAIARNWFDRPAPI